MIKDSDNDELTYLPIFGLEEGDTWGPEIIKIDTPVVDGMLRADDDPRILVEARVSGIGSYVNIASSPIDLSVLSAGTTDFQIKVTAVSPIDAVERVPVYVAPSVAGPAAWLS